MCFMLEFVKPEALEGYNFISIKSVIVKRLTLMCFVIICEEA